MCCRGTECVLAHSCSLGSAHSVSANWRMAGAHAVCLAALSGTEGHVQDDLSASSVALLPPCGSDLLCVLCVHGVSGGVNNTQRPVQGFCRVVYSCEFRVALSVCGLLRCCMLAADSAGPAPAVFGCVVSLNQILPCAEAVSASAKRNMQPPRLPPAILAPT